MNPFDQAWSILKDFYFGEGDEYGMARMTRGGVETTQDYDSHLQGAGNLGNRMVGTNAYEQAWGKFAPEHYPQDNRAYSTETQTKPMHERQAGDTRFTAGMNLSNVASELKEGLGDDDPKVSNAAFDEFVTGENDIYARGVAPIMAHEYGHGLSNDDIWAGAVDHQRWAGPHNDEWRKKAHEIGAYSLMYPGGADADIDARYAASSHPDMRTDTFTEDQASFGNITPEEQSKMLNLQNKIPFPAYASGSQGIDPAKFQQILNDQNLGYLYPTSSVGVPHQSPNYFNNQLEYTLQGRDGTSIGYGNESL